MNLEKACNFVFESEASDLYPAGSAAWTLILAAIEAGTLHVETKRGPWALLHCAAFFCSATVFKRLLDLGASPSVADKYGTRPMHLAVQGGYDVVAKCAMLPLGDLACLSELFGTPLHACVAKVIVWAPPLRLGHDHDVFDKYLDVLQWMLAQPECPVGGADIFGRTAMDILNGKENCGEARDMFAAELARRARWTALRAAWVGGVVVAEKASGKSAQIAVKVTW
jgi:hypothetical protein